MEFVLSTSLSTAKPSPEVVLFSVAFSIVTGIVVGCLFLAAVAGNALVIATLRRTWQFTQTKTSNSLVFLLAITDLTNAILVLPFVLVCVGHRGQWVLGDAMCQITGFVYIFLTTTTNNILSMISFNRYQVVQRPNVHERVTRVRTLRMGAYSLGLGLIVATSLVVPWGTIGFETGTDIMCVPIWDDTPRSITNQLFVSILGFFLPLITMLATYFKIVSIVKFRSRKVTPVEGTVAADVVFHISSDNQRNQPRRSTIFADRRWSILPNRGLVIPAETMEVRAILTLLIVIGIFCVCWVPSVVVTFVRAFDGLVPGPVQAVVVLLTLLNSAANPIVYSFRSPAFRLEATELLKCARTNSGR